MLSNTLEKIANSLTINESITYLAVLVVAILSLYLYIQNEIKNQKETILKEYIDTEEELVSYLKNIEPQLKYERSTYKNFLEKNLMYIDNILGKLTFFSYQALNKHILYSLIYSLFFFYISWLFGNEVRMGNLQLMGNNNKLVTSIFLLFTIVFLYYNFKHRDNIIMFINKYLPDTSYINKSLIDNIIFLGAAGTVGVGVGAGGILGITLGVGVGVILGVGGARGVLGIAAVAVGVGVGVAEHNTLTLAYLILLFFIILPLVNAVFDYISMYFSRFFAYRILKDSKGKIVLAIFLDSIVALILLFLLAYTLYYVLDFVNISIIKDKTIWIPIETYKTQILTNPLDKEVLWITLMFVSTLVPTLTHIGLALFSFVADIMIKPQLHSLYEQLESLLVTENITKREKAKIAENLAFYDLSTRYKLYILAETILLILLAICLFIFAVKIEWYSF